MTLALAGLLLLAAQAPAQASLAPISYLVVSAGPSWEPSINNSGEIVFVTRDDSGFPNVVSTRRGQITRSTTGHLRYPEMNERGEIVYADRVPSSLQFQVWSTVRGLISQRYPANAPAISDTGEVCFVSSEPRQVSLHTDRRGRVLDLGDSVGTTCDLNSMGEIVYRSIGGNGYLDERPTDRR